jgi:hypothetical protein
VQVFDENRTKKKIGYNGVRFDYRQTKVFYDIFLESWWPLCLWS